MKNSPVFYPMLLIPVNSIYIFHENYIYWVCVLKKTDYWIFMSLSWSSNPTSKFCFHIPSGILSAFLPCCKALRRVHWWSRFALRSEGYFLVKVAENDRFIASVWSSPQEVLRGAISWWSCRFLESSCSHRLALKWVDLSTLILTEDHESGFRNDAFDCQ